jgi:hypothetical protein
MDLVGKINEGMRVEIANNPSVQFNAILAQDYGHLLGC